MKAPFILAWELTKACNLDCLHCRACAKPDRDPDELSTAEGLRLLDDLAAFGTRMVILSGGEALVRPDALEFARHGTRLGLRMTLASNGALVTPEVAREMLAAGIARVSISLDGVSADIHDAFRGRPGAFELALQGIENLRAAGVPVQVNTTVAAMNIHQMQALPDFIQSLGVCAWHVFFLVPTGRGQDLPAATVQEYKGMLEDFAVLYRAGGMECKATCAPQFYRMLEEDGQGAKTKGCLAGGGFGFVSATGAVQPCGFLDLACGNIRTQPFAEIWTDSTHLQKLRDPEALEGKCGACGHKNICGGCRARAYEIRGDYLKTDPICWYPHGK